MKDNHWNLLTILALIATLLVIGYTSTVFANPYTGLNPLPPPPLPDVFLPPTATPTLLQLPPTWTFTVEEVIFTPTPLPSSTPEPSSTGLILPTQTETNTPTVTVTQTLSILPTRTRTRTLAPTATNEPQHPTQPPPPSDTPVPPTEPPPPPTESPPPPTEPSP